MFTYFPVILVLCVGIYIGIVSWKKEIKIATASIITALTPTIFCGYIMTVKVGDQTLDTYVFSELANGTDVTVKLLILSLIIIGTWYIYIMLLKETIKYEENIPEDNPFK